MKNPGAKKQSVVKWQFYNIYLNSFVLFAVCEYRAFLKLYHALIGQSASHYMYYLEVDHYNWTIA